MQKLFTSFKNILYFEPFFTNTIIFIAFGISLTFWEIPVLLGVASTASINAIVGFAFSAGLMAAFKTIYPLWAAPQKANKKVDLTAKLSTEMTALQLHVLPFAEKELPNGDLVYTGSSIANRLAKAGSMGSTAKGPIISMFNATHSGARCPFSRGVLPNNQSIAQSLHLGTTRIWDENGHVNEKRFNAFVRACVSEHPEYGLIFTPKNIKAYLLDCSRKDPIQENTGRNTLSTFSSRFVQEMAADKAWDELFASYKTGMVDGEPYLNYHAMYLFFHDTNALVKEVEARQCARKTR